MVMTAILIHSHSLQFQRDGMNMIGQCIVQSHTIKYHQFSGKSLFYTKILLVCSRTDI
jgi:hypothetical protein